MNTSSTNEKHPFVFRGLIEKPEMTSYMYGTHTISNDTKRYALQSKTIDLDRYIQKTVSIKGDSVKGYPVDGGPVLIDVKAVEEK